MESIGANVLVGALQDVLRLNLSVANCRGLCYDGAANMADITTGVVHRLVRTNGGKSLHIVMGIH